MKSFATRRIREWKRWLLMKLLRDLTKDSNLVRHTQHELKSWFAEGPDSMNRMMADHMEGMMRLFALEGHSGSSAPYALSLFKTLANFEPFGPLTGEDSEWNDCSYGGRPLWQNNRCSRVFKGADGRAYDGEGRIFRYPDGSCFTNRDSRVYIDFPYIPKREYVDVPFESKQGSVA